MATDIGTVNGHALSVELKEQCRNETGLNTCEFVYGEKHSDFLCTISLQPIHHAINSMITDSGQISQEKSIGKLGLYIIFRT